MPHTLILGLGNTLLSDDGAGVHALRYLRSRARPDPAVAFLDGGTLSFTLLPAIEDSHQLIVLDATQMNAEPGTVRCFEGTDLEGLLSRPRRSVHEVSLLDLLASARLAGMLPARRALVGVQPRRLGWGDRPSPEVASAIPWMAEIALERHQAWRERDGGGPKAPAVATETAERP